MTLPTWLSQFTTQAATLPGWGLINGTLRCVDAHGQYCPLMAQWNVGHPGCPVVVPAPYLTLFRLWRGALGPQQIEAIVCAADTPSRDLSPRRAALRAHLLAACGVEDSPAR